MAPMGEHETDDDLLRLAAEVLGRHRDPGDHSPNCVDGDPCRYCLSDAAAVLEAVLPEVWARAISDVAYQFQMGGWTILTAPPPAGAIPSIALGQRVTDWLRARADEERGAGR